jgi:PAS domain S-box-containing protein
VTYLVFGGARSEGAPLPLAFLPLPLVIWAAIRFTQREVTTAVAMVCGMAIWFTVNGHGPFGQWSNNVAMLLLLAYTSTLVMTGIALGAVTRGRERAMTELREVKDDLAKRVDERTQELAEANRMLHVELEERSRREAVLRRSEERFRLLVDGVKDYAIFSLDPNGYVASWNKGAQSIKGYTAAEIIGKHFSTFYTPEDLARRWPEHELAIARVEGRFEDEGWRVRKDGTRFWANVIIAALYDDDRRLYGFAKVTRDLTARRRMEAMQESARQMNEFLAMLSHELRNPLAAMVNALGVLRNEPGNKLGRAGDVFERQVKHLSHIVDDLLDVSRITRGKITLKNEVVDLKELVARVVESSRPTMDRRRHEFDIHLADEPLPVHADPTRLSQVVINLVGNAAKYTPHGGRIAVTVEREGDLAVLRVRDNGIGIAPELLPKIFDLFVQGESSLARTEGGLGIGLTLAKRLIELQGGSIAASSGGRGKGSEFIVRLPLATVDATAQRAEATQTPEAVRRRLLVVDDNRDFAIMLTALLETMGHDVRTAYDGPTAISLAAEYLPDAVFLDIGLPGMSGYEVARTLRNSPAQAGVTLVAFTGYGQDDDRRRVREAGFDNHLVKPAQAAELARIIDSLPGRA